MPFAIAADEWEATCAHCFIASPLVRAKTEDDAIAALSAAGWLTAQPDAAARKWWCPECRLKLFDTRRRGRRR